MKAPGSAGAPGGAAAGHASDQPYGGTLSSAHCTIRSAQLSPEINGLTDGVLYPVQAQRALAGRVARFALTATEQKLEVARDQCLDAWTFNGSIPGPTLRVTEGDDVEVLFRNRGKHGHTVHFHGIHPAVADGLEPIVAPGQDYTYRFKAEPFGVFIYHCHVMPLGQHISKGMYGVLIIDPPEPRPAAEEMVMVMNGYDLNGDGRNELYSVNGPAGYYARHPIPLTAGRLIRVYLANLTEYDLINSFHLHANVFAQLPAVKGLQPVQWDDTVMLCQGQRAILEFTYPSPGRFMFHAHQSSFAERGWSGFFEVA